MAINQTPIRLPTREQVRCPACGKLIVESLEGTITFTCPRPRCSKRWEINSETGTITPLTQAA